MRAMTVVPGKADSAAVTEVAEPPESDGSVLVEGVLVGICGTDVEIVSGAFGRSADATRMVLGHESLGRVIEGPAGSGLNPGDLVAGIVRRPDPVPCPACARGEFDFCRNGLYSERGINGVDGYGSERWRVDPYYAVPVPPELGRLGVLVEPASILTKAWDQVDQVGARSWYEPKHVLVTGAGPIGLLAALIAAQRGYAVHVLDRSDQGPKPALVRDLGGEFLTELADLKAAPDVVIEATGVGQVVVACAELLPPAGVLCLTGISPSPDSIDVQMDALTRQLVIRNAALVGSVNAAKRHYADAVDVLLAADRSWLDRLITRTVPLADWPAGLVKEPDDIKVVVDLRA
ncbi:threonine dehydrogenase-like Zn-dependent dehydrogenase [Kribbella sp. VKM Ac-2527]|uniref:Threonine dehydrogenase-like Zn-dependent dehydrogenase n=1 Tax=Kribbella caucasensis TaxID=2512215 RepID=A0A4R6K9D0_9ACTN|nr:glucose 1-dehydrogenase [Kribbella sp. VKM Ac-2527]TDO46288.1 threonine dehydrogenase-like Zn-dependent dehydrogenase [Kribbella sp. VKM Ac-2527]